MMRIALAALGFVNKATERNLQTILDTMQQYSGSADLILFGEAFLQGFDAANFDPLHDVRIAVAVNDPIMSELRKAAHLHGVAVSFGFLEQDGPVFYSSQLTISASGDVADHYRRVSPGWKLPEAGDRYREGEGFHTFSLAGKRMAVGLCGDFWYDESIDSIRRLSPDVVLWPVYTDYSPLEWNTEVKQEYAAQAGRLNTDVLYVNSVCIDRSHGCIAEGGAALFSKGQSKAEIPSGKAGVLLVDLP